MYSPDSYLPLAIWVLNSIKIKRYCSCIIDNDIKNIYILHQSYLQYYRHVILKIHKIQYYSLNNNGT